MEKDDITSSSGVGPYTRKLVKTTMFGLFAGHSQE